VRGLPGPAAARGPISKCCLAACRTLQALQVLTHPPVLAPSQRRGADCAALFNWVWLAPSLLQEDEDEDEDEEDEGEAKGTGQKRKRDDDDDGEEEADEDDA
jgi:hypothetical protein